MSATCKYQGKAYSSREELNIVLPGLPPPLGEGNHFFPPVRSNVKEHIRHGTNMLLKIYREQGIVGEWVDHIELVAVRENHIVRGEYHIAIY